MPPIDDEVRYYLLKLLETSPQLSQRQLAKTMGVSLGKANYCLRAFIERGWVKAKNFSQSQKNPDYTYFLTPKKINKKARATARFLKLKIRQYENLKARGGRRRRGGGRAGGRAGAGGRGA